MKKIIRTLICLVLAAALLTGCGLDSAAKKLEDQVSKAVDGVSKAADDMSKAADDMSGAAGDVKDIIAETIVALERHFLVKDMVSETKIDVIPAVKTYEMLSDLDMAVNGGAFSFNDEERELMLKNRFFVQYGYIKEFFKIYEMNRYGYEANFVTVDSMMHTYHLFFSYLLKNLERGSLSGTIADISSLMVEESLRQYSELKGTEWEEAAVRNIEYFGVAQTLIEGGSDVPGFAQQTVTDEVDKIMAADSIYDCDITGAMLDYSQFKPRGYYEGDPALEKYFRAMMWYGQVNFTQSDEDLERSTVLMILALKEAAMDMWEELYTITSFFAGSSDDLTYYEYYPVITAAYGEDIKAEDLAGKTDEWEAFRTLSRDSMPSPAINSIPIYDDEDPETISTEINKGYRFMGQRFSIDEAVFQKLIYENVQPDPEGRKRMLPDTLDVAAALGSDKALEILDEQGDTAYENYTENMDFLQDAIATADDSLWEASLYSSWLYTLKPLLDEKGDGYPDFMRSEEWLKKDIETFAGSYAELKHDTILYAKQAMAEMGGGPIPEYDDRGYVEPEVEVWARFAALAEMTAEGLKSYGVISAEDEEELYLLSELAKSLRTISEKELREELLTDEEYDLIRYFGGNLEHFWMKVYENESDRPTINDFPSAIIADVATDPNGRCLEVGTGCPGRIYVLVYFDGGYHICSGAVYTFYQFEQPLSDRLTDSSWRQMMGIEVDASGRYNEQKKAPPQWTMSYKTSRF